MKKLCFIIIIAVTGCQGFVIDKTVAGKFHLIAVDVKENLSLSYNLNNGDYIGVVNQTVFAVGHNDKYIIVKQHPQILGKNFTDYYIVPVIVKNQYWIEKEVIGPLRRDQFEQKKKELNIENLEFTIVYENLE
jgi:hypothetical protein